MKSINVFILSVTVMLMLAACGQKAQISSSWLDPSFEGYGANNILVMGVSRNETRLKLFENVFVDQFSKSNVQAMASFKVIGQVVEPDRKIVEAAVLETGASSVLITHVVDSRTETEKHPGTVHFQPGGYYDSMYDYYSTTFHAIYTPPSSISRTIIRLESNLYDAATAKLVWSAQSDTVDLKLLRTDFEQIVDLLIADMKKKKVVK